MDNSLSILAIIAWASTEVAQPIPPLPAPGHAPLPLPLPVPVPVTVPVGLPGPVTAPAPVAVPTPVPVPAPVPGPVPVPTVGAPTPAPGANPSEPGPEAGPSGGDGDGDGGGSDGDRRAGSATVGYDQGFFLRTADERYTLRLTSRVQPYYSLNVLRDPVDVETAFEIRRARVVLEGNAHTKSLEYKAQFDFGRGFVTLKDFYFDGELVEGTWLRVGQWKRPFSRQQITSSGRLELTDRAITDPAFLARRDIGVAVHNMYEDSLPFEWVVGLMNGTGDTPHFDPVIDPETGEVIDGAFTNVPLEFKPAIVARAGINRNGIKGYSEGDLEGGPLRYAIAADLHIEGDADDDNVSNQKLSADYIVKVNGFSSTGGFYMMTRQTGSSPTDLRVGLLGFHVQVGYMVTRRIQGAARYAFVDSRIDDALDQQEIAVGGNYYWYGHDVKLAAAMRLLTHVDAGVRDALLIEVTANVGF